jgi:hypothetical protein
VGVSGQDTVHAQAMVVDSNLASMTISPDWTPSDPDMITVSPNPGDHVTILVKRAGESTLDVSWQGMAKRLVVRATSARGKVVQVEISQ